MDVHDTGDISRSRPLKEGMVITIGMLLTLMFCVESWRDTSLPSSHPHSFFFSHGDRLQNLDFTSRATQHIQRGIKALAFALKITS